MLELPVGHRALPARLARCASYVFLILVGATMAFPLFWMFSASLKTVNAEPADLRQLLPREGYSYSAVNIRDWPALCRRLAAPEDPLGRRIPALARQRAERAAARGAANPADREELAAALNNLVGGGRLWEDPALAARLPAGERPPPGGPAPAGENAPRLNRAILDAELAGIAAGAHRWHWENYAQVLGETGLWRAFLNSLFVALAVTLGQVLTSSLAAFAFARLRFRGRDRLFVGYLATLMVPVSVTVIPTYVLLRELRWLDTYLALIVPAMFTAYGTFLLRQYFLSVPRDLEEAAVVDGCSAWGVYWHVVLPICKPALAALAILTFVNNWRAFLWPLITCHSQRLFTLPVALADFQNSYATQWGLLMAGSLLMILPLIVVFVVGQKQFISGITVGAVKE